MLQLTCNDIIKAQSPKVLKTIFTVKNQYPTIIAEIKPSVILVSRIIVNYLSSNDINNRHTKTTSTTTPLSDSKVTRVVLSLL